MLHMYISSRKNSLPILRSIRCVATTRQASTLPRLPPTSLHRPTRTNTHTCGIRFRAQRLAKPGCHGDRSVHS